MSTVVPLPIEIAIPKIPLELPPEGRPRWRITRPKTWVHDPIPVEIEFPVHRPRTVELPVRITVPGIDGTFEVRLQLTAVESAQAPR